jgi:hypothetical protein
MALERPRADDKNALKIGRKFAIDSRRTARPQARVLPLPRNLFLTGVRFFLDRVLELWHKL